MRTLLILGAGDMQVPAFHAAKALGVEVVAIDPSPGAPGFALADASYCRDLRDHVACLKIARDHAIHGVMTLAADYPIPAVAELCEALNLAGVRREIVRAVTHKAEMYRVLRSAGAPVPRSISVSTSGEAQEAVCMLGGQTILKPADSSGGRGVTSFDPTPDPDQVREAFQRSVEFGCSGDVIVSELVEGPEYSVETLTWGGSTTVVAVTEKLTTGHPFHVEIGHSQPPRLPDQTIALLGEVATSAIAALGIDSTPGHTEIRLSPTGPRIIEVGARLGGGYITSSLVPLSYGVDLVRAAVQLALGEEPDLRTNHSGGPRGAAIRFIAPAPGRVRSIEGIDEARRSPGVRQLKIDWTVGQQIPVLMNATERSGYVICDGPDVGTAIRNVERALELVRIDTDAS